MTGKPNNVMARIKAVRGRMEPRKVGVLVALLAVALFLWGRMLLQDAPSTARAGVAASSSAKVKVQGSKLKAVDAGDVSGVSGGALRFASRLNGDAAFEDATSGAVVVEAGGLPRDLFGFAAAGASWTNPSESGQGRAKSDVKPSDEQLQLAAVRQAAGKLKLQSVVRGEEPRAVINGQLLAPGQDIAGFTLVGIQRRSVILERHGIRVRLEM